MSIPLFKRSRKTNLVYLNELKKYVLPWWLVPQNIVNRNDGILAVPANATRNCMMTPDQNGPFEGMYLTCDLFGGDMTVRINDAGFTRDLMNRDVLVSTIMTPAPGGQNVFILPETLWLEQRHSLLFTFTDQSGAANSVRPVLHGRKFFLRQAPAGLGDRFLARRRMQRKVSTPYWFTTDQAVQLANGAAGARANITIGGEGHFVAYKITCQSDGPFEFRLIDGETGAALSGSVFVSNTNCTGIGMDPYVFPEPWFIEKDRLITVEMNNLNALGANNIWFTMSGRRIYDESYREIV